MSVIDRFFNAPPSGVQRRLAGTYRPDGFMEAHKDSPTVEEALAAPRRNPPVRVAPPPEKLTKVEIRRREREQEYRAYVDAGMSLAEIAEKRGVTRQTVAKELSDLGIRAPASRKMGTIDETIARLFAEGKVAKQIAHEVGRAQNTVNDRIRKMGLRG